MFYEWMFHHVIIQLLQIVHSLQMYSVPKHSHLDAHINRALLWSAEHGFRACAEEWSKRLNYAAYVAVKVAVQEKKSRSGHTTSIALVDILHMLQVHYCLLGFATVVCAVEVVLSWPWHFLGETKWFAVVRNRLTR